MGVMRANFVVFPLSIRNSPAAIAHLINQVGVKHILVSGEQPIRDLAQDSLDMLKLQYPSAVEPEVSPMLTFEELFRPSVEGSVANPLPYQFTGADSPSVILHSSGSYLMISLFTCATMIYICVAYRLNSVS